MKRLLALGLLVAVVLIALGRNRLFLRDPLARVTRDGKPLAAAIYIDYPNDVLIESGSNAPSPLAPRTLIEHWNLAPGEPARLTCIRWMACLTDRDHATMTPLTATGSRHGGRGYDPAVRMTSRRIDYIDSSGEAVSVTLW